jgi:hypothetical protein
MHVQSDGWAFVSLVIPAAMLGYTLQCELAFPKNSRRVMQNLFEKS